MTSPTRPGARSGRGAVSNPTGRFESTRTEEVDDGWGNLDEELPPLATIVQPEPARSIISRNDSPDISFDQSINPYRGCEHGCIYCLAGDTRILMADGSHKPLSDLGIGDEIYGTEKRGHYRRYVQTRVLAHWRTVKPVYRIRLADGTELHASGDHRFLTERGWKFVSKGEESRRRPYLTVNNTLMGFGATPALQRPQDPGAYRRGYLCGVIRGDGHLGLYRYSRPGRAHGDQHRFRLAMADVEALDRAALFLADFGIGTDRFTFQEEKTARQRVEAIRTSSRANVAAITRLIEWPDRGESDWMRGFIGGIFDAEGSYSDGCIRIANTDSRMIGVLSDGLRALSFDSIVETPRPHAPKPVHYVRVRGGLREHLRFMGAFDPAIRRKRNIEAQAVKSAASLEVVEIEPLGRDAELFDITTGTEDFIANGVISHNCYARPSHAYLNLSPGLDFETRLFYKQDAARLLEQELAAPSYRCSPITIGANTDPYQPIEREYRVTRSIIEVLAKYRHPFSIITKSAMIERDIDLLAPLAADGLVYAMVSVTTLSNELKRTLEPRTASPAARLRAIRNLHEAGIPVGVMVAPIIPVLTDHELERILAAAVASGAQSAAYVLLRLPYELKDLFREWLETNEPLKAKHVMSRLQAMRGGKDNDARFGTRQRGEGEYAALLARRFATACARLGLKQRERFAHNLTLFRPPVFGPEQLSLL
jgi:DNA repair photolyase